MKTKGGRFCYGVSDPLRDGEIHRQVTDETQANTKISGPSAGLEPRAGKQGSGMAWKSGKETEVQFISLTAAGVMQHVSAYSTTILSIAARS